MSQNKFIVDQKRLSTILASMQAICAKRTTLDATTSILFQTNHHELVLKSTDLELSLQYSCPLDTHLDDVSEGVFLVPGKRVFELTKELDGAIHFDVKDASVSIKAGKAQLSLNIKSADEFPPFPERIENLMELDRVDVLNMIEKVAFVIPQNNANPALNGLLIEFDFQGLRMTATDGHCLAQAHTKKYALSELRTWLLPRRAILELKKILDTTQDVKIFVGICGNQLVFSGESFNLFTKVLVDSFPEYQHIIKKDGFTKRITSKADLIKALRRASCLLSGQFIATEFNFNDNVLEVATQNKEVGKLQEQLSLKESVDEHMAIRFYAPYLLTGIQALPGDDVAFWLKNKTRPIIFESHDDDLYMLYLVMPVSPLNNE
jgi:DNA polymerase III subunit beta